MNSEQPTQNLLKDIGFTLLSEGKTIRVKANGYSMYPSVRPGSIICIEPMGKGEEVSPGEIVAWKRDSGLVVHRLKRIAERNGSRIYYTQGDSVLLEDIPFDREQIAGKVVNIESPEGNAVPPSEYLHRKPNHLLNRIRVRFRVYYEKLLKKVS